MLFRTSQSKLCSGNNKLYLRQNEQNEIEQVDFLKFLSVFINEHLSWSKPVFLKVSHLAAKGGIHNLKGGKFVKGGIGEEFE